jgi:predicted pyridoxine 5'-phosphate oxidase superfamily flavin-nucleotide-binding protein
MKRRIEGQETNEVSTKDHRQSENPPIDYSPSSRALQDQFDTRRLADRLAEVKVRNRFAPEDRQFIERMDMFFLATVDGSGQPTCSYKGGDPGFVTVLDDTTLVFPNYDGNGMYLSMGNVAETQGVGLLFIDFEHQRRMRVDGVAQIALADPLVERYPGAQFLVRVEARRVYPNCPRYIHKYQLVERSEFVPRDSRPTPVPGWKRTPWASDVLPANDPARQE